MSSSRRRGSTFFVGTIFSDEQQGCLEPQKIWYCHKDCSNDAECYYIVSKIWIHTESSTWEHHHSETFTLAVDKISRAYGASDNTDEESGWVHIRYILIEIYTIVSPLYFLLPLSFYQYIARHLWSRAFESQKWKFPWEYSRVVGFWLEVKYLIHQHLSHKSFLNN